MASVENSKEYDVCYGPKKEVDREWKRGLSEEAAIKLFREKSALNMHVDVYEIVTIRTTIKLT